jgi:predicted molibdopterin-dependent oxidoreductase YjgC
MVAEVNKFGKVVRFKGDLAGAANNGQACMTGKFGYDYTNHNSRLRRPYVREGGILRKATWEEALKRISLGMGGRSPGEVAVITAPRGSNEDQYVAAKFADSILRTPNIDSGLNTNDALLSQLEKRIGTGAATNPIWDLENSRSIMVVGGNPTEEQNVLAVPAKKAIREGAKLVVIDSRETEFTRYATEWLRPKPGSEPLLVAGISRVILDESLEDKTYVDSRIKNVTELKQSLWAFDLAKISRATGIEESQIRRAARLFAESDAGAILVGNDGLDDTATTQVVDAVVNLAAITGNLGEDSSGIFPLFNGANTLGARDMGVRPRENGLDVTKMISGMRDTTIKAALVMADGMSGYSKDLDGLISGLEKLEFLAVSAVFDSEITAHADVVLPAATYAEQTSTVTNLERRVQLLRITTESREEIQTGWETICLIANAMGGSGFDYSSSSDIFSEISGVFPNYANLSHDLLQSGGIQWPTTEEDNSGTPILFDASDELITVIPLDYDQFADSISDNYLMFAPGRVLSQPERDVQVRKPQEKNYIDREQLVQIHPTDGIAAGVREGDAIHVKGVDGHTLAYGTAVFESPQPGLVGVTTLFGELATRMHDLEIPDWSPHMPHLGYSKVLLELPTGEKESQSEAAAD